jgi:hypothetical protein
VNRSEPELDSTESEDSVSTSSRQKYPGLLKTLQRTALPWGFLPLQRIQAQAATHIGLTAPDSAAPSGFLNLLTLLFRLRPHGLVSCRIRSWGSAFRGFPLPKAATALHRACPLLEFAVYRETLRSFRGLCDREVRSQRGWFYPASTSRSSPSLDAPPRNTPIGPWLRVFAKPPLIGLVVTLDESIVTTAFQSVKEPKGQFLSFENHYPP